MAKTAGRLATLRKNAVTIAGARTTGFTVNGSAIDVTDQGDLGFQTLLTGVVIGQSIELTIDGYEEGTVLRDIAVGPQAGKFMSDLSYVAANGDAITGNFFMSSYSEGAPYEDGTTFNATFTSNGAWTFTPAT